MLIQNKWRSVRPMFMLVASSALLLGGMVSMVGCETPQTTHSLTEIRSAYVARDYDKAYRLGTWNASQNDDASARQAAYMAGMSAYKLGRNKEAIQSLTQASRSSDKSMAGDSQATIGLIYASQNNHRPAAAHFLRAASLLTGQAKANAYFYAAVSQQKIGRWADARSHLSLARIASNDQNFKRQVDDQFAVTGYSLQVGAYSDVANAQQAAEHWAQKIQEFRIGQPRLVPQTTVDGTAVTAVQFGQFSSYATALMARQDLADKTIIVVPLR